MIPTNIMWKFGRPVEARTARSAAAAQIRAKQACGRRGVAQAPVLELEGAVFFDEFQDMSWKSVGIVFLISFSIKLKNVKKNDIIYWKGHVALAISNKKLITINIKNSLFRRDQGPSKDCTD